MDLPCVLMVRSDRIQALSPLLGGSRSLHLGSILIFQTVSPRTKVNKGKEEGRRSMGAPTRKGFTASLLPFSNKPELLQHAQIVVALPLLDYLAILDAVYGDAFEFYTLASGRAQLLSLAPMGAA